MTRDQAERLFDYLDARMRLYGRDWSRDIDAGNKLRETGDMLRNHALDAFGPAPVPVHELPTRNWRIRFKPTDLNRMIPGRVLTQAKEVMSGDTVITYHGHKLEGAEEA